MSMGLGLSLNFDWASIFDVGLLAAVGQIVWINLLLSGDNAVVIALACRSLPEDKRKLGIALGAGAAVALRVLFTAIVATLLGLPFVRIVGGLLLLWIAVKLLTDRDEGADVAASASLWKAVRTIAIADMVMSLDNVLAIAGAANGSLALIVFGLLLSVPLIVLGAGLLLDLLKRYPIFVWGGAALLGWVAGEMIVSDAAWSRFVGWPPGEITRYAASGLGAALVAAVGWLVTRRRPAKKG